MPGPVVEAHQDLEAECDNCHSRFDRSSQRALCLDCHEEVAADLSAQTGFHGLHNDASQLECSRCHTEHKGRSADVVGLVEDLFDHDFTDFPLAGAHEHVQCDSCHDDGVALREAPTECTSCHEDDDTHDGRLGNECGTCHNPSTWDEVLFDHDVETEFPLSGAHLDTLCAGCHVNEVYENTPQECVACHRLDDVHGGARGDDCQACHTTERWDEAEFDHEAETDFALEGGHESLACHACHLADMSLVEPPTTCAGCHGVNDPHLGANGDDCESCHSQNSWELAFDHLEVTGFALSGSHADAECTSCHKGALTDPIDANCFACHLDDDPHGGQLTQCETCHSEDQWAAGIRFHHDLTDFPLLGGHRLASCEQCHDEKRFADMTESTCVDCHRDDDVHERSLGTDCAMCHSPVAWELWDFDHATTGYDLVGAHDGLVCNACHALGNDDTPPTSCIGCHRQDDIHRGDFGTNCLRCHTTETFAEPRIGRSG